MPKRKRNKCQDSEYSYLSKKIRKLEKRLRRSRRSDTESTDSEHFSPHYPLECDPAAAVDNSVAECLPGCSYWSDREYLDTQEIVEVDAPLPLTISPLCHTDVPADSIAIPPPMAAVTPPSTAVQLLNVTAAESQLPSTNDLPPTASTADRIAAPQLSTNDPELDPDLMEILGKDPTSVKKYGDDIQKDLAIRLNHIATSGLSKENRQELKEKYLVPSNCKFIGAPNLNLEFKASLIESQTRRDKAIENKQEMTARALSSLSAGITLLLSSDNKNPELLKLLMDTARQLGDLQYINSLSRRSAILSTVKKELRDQLEKTKIDETLFGSNLSDNLKSAKTINKSGADMRVASTVKRITQAQVQTSGRPLNFKAPPVLRRPPPGGPRLPRGAHLPPAQKQTTTQTQHSATKPSSRQPQPRYRR